jgi:hypothetical protein
MREILFRGQTRRFGEKVKNFAGDPMPSNWVYGGVCCGKGAFSIIYDYMDEEKEKPIEKRVVYTDTIGQYTGLTDKNGKKIFEGDIVKWDGDEISNIRYCDGVYRLCNEKGYYGVSLHNHYSYVEVIGNIHDNPELLKGE